MSIRDKITLEVMKAVNQDAGVDTVVDNILFLLGAKEIVGELPDFLFKDNNGRVKISYPMYSNVTHELSKWIGD